MPSLTHERVGPLAIFTLDRPDVLNAIDEPLTSALAEQLQGCAVDAAVRAVVITGAGRAFSAGQDLRDRAAMVEEGKELHLGAELRRRYHPVVTAIREMRKPVIAAVNGIALGAGLGIALCCDVRVASSSASFRAAWCRVGLAPDAGAAYFLPRIVGLGRAVDMILTGDAVDAEEALRIGLVTRVWSDTEFAREWKAYAMAIAQGATEAYALSKESLNAAWDRDLRSFLDLEVELQDRAGRTRDYAEAIRAFAEKRRARFVGR
ncbi:MAG TPA: enoyl-CoA hydratase-related protein [Candidatus Limnocylindria bacterium]|nr:enoyl-CoA hydratase-related protein [Candidatus Limnocylindria bacterium]